MLKQKRIFLWNIAVIFILLIGTLLYAIFSDNDPYRYYTGLGETISISPDDNKIAFSYYVDGKESIYTADINGMNVKKVTDSENQQEHTPKFLPDGKKLLYLSEDENSVQTMGLINEDGTEEHQLTNDELHITDAIFSLEGDTIFFVGIETDEFMLGEESRGGFDLYSLVIDGMRIEKLTNDDHFSMNHLFLSPDGKIIYYSEFDGQADRIYSYSLESRTVNHNPSILPEKLIQDQSFYEPQLSPDESYLVFTDVSKESKESSLFKYELFLLDLKTNQIERLTYLENAVVSPVFFHQSNKIAFLENINWAKPQAVYQLMTIDLSTQAIEAVNLDAPKSAGGNTFNKLLEQSVNGLTLAILYVLLLVLLSVYFHHYRPRKAYLPSILSFSLAILTLVASFAVAMMVNPWYGIGLGMVAAGIFCCSLVILLFIFIYRRFTR